MGARSKKQPSCGRKSMLRRMRRMREIGESESACAVCGLVMKRREIPRHVKRHHPTAANPPDGQPTEAAVDDNVRKADKETAPQQQHVIVLGDDDVTEAAAVVEASTEVGVNVKVAVKVHAEEAPGSAVTGPTDPCVAEQQKQQRRRPLAQPLQPVAHAYICHVCYKKLGSLKGLRSHMSQAHSLREGGRQETIGEAYAATSDEKEPLKQHAAADAQHRTEFRCDQCGEVFAKKKTLRHHVDAEHRTEFRCERCGEAFDRKKSLLQHVVAQHRTWFRCERCGEAFDRKSDLWRHVREAGHQPEHQCADCGKTFARSNTLARHRLVHSQHRPHPCPQCGKKFKTPKYLEQHLAVHLVQKPYECDQCGSVFARLDQLRAHQRVHTGEKPYVCELCGQRFSHNVTRKDHIRKRHPDAPEVEDLLQSYKRRKLASESVPPPSTSSPSPDSPPLQDDDGDLHTAVASVEVLDDDAPQATPPSPAAAAAPGDQVESTEVCEDDVEEVVDVAEEKVPAALRVLHHAVIDERVTMEPCSPAAAEVQDVDEVLDEVRESLADHEESSSSSLSSVSFVPAALAAASRSSSSSAANVQDPLMLLLSSPQVEMDCDHQDDNDEDEGGTGGVRVVEARSVKMEDDLLEVIEDLLVVAPSREGSASTTTRSPSVGVAAATPRTAAPAARRPEERPPPSRTTTATTTTASGTLRLPAKPKSPSAVVPPPARPPPPSIPGELKMMTTKESVGQRRPARRSPTMTRPSSAVAPAPPPPTPLLQLPPPPQPPLSSRARLLASVIAQVQADRGHTPGGGLCSFMDAYFVRELPAVFSAVDGRLHGPWLQYQCGACGKPTLLDASDEQQQQEQQQQQEEEEELDVGLAVKSAVETGAAAARLIVRGDGRQQQQQQQHPFSTAGLYATRPLSDNHCGEVAEGEDEEEAGGEENFILKLEID